jgi:hypothetical protein
MLSSRSPRSSQGQRCFAGRYQVFLLLFCLALSAFGAFGATVRLAWDRNPELYVAGYKVHYGSTLNAYPNVIDTGAATTVAISNLVEGATYYFVVTAYSILNVESAFSAPLVYKVPYTGGLFIRSFTVEPGGLRVTWQSQPGLTYRVLSKTKLNQPTWSIRSANVTATSTNTSWVDSAVTRTDCRFYIVEVVPIPALDTPFRINSITPIPRAGVVINWNSRPGSSYRVFSRDSLKQSTWTARGTVTALGLSTSWTDPAAATGPARFYRVEMLPLLGLP